MLDADHAWCHCQDYKTRDKCTFSSLNFYCRRIFFSAAFFLRSASFFAATECTSSTPNACRSLFSGWWRCHCRTIHDNDSALKTENCRTTATTKNSTREWNSNSSAVIVCIYVRYVPKPRPITKTVNRWDFRASKTNDEKLDRKRRKKRRQHKWSATTHFTSAFCQFVARRSFLTSFFVFDQRSIVELLCVCVRFDC